MTKSRMNILRSFRFEYHHNNSNSSNSGSTTTHLESVQEIALVTMPFIYQLRQAKPSLNAIEYELDMWLWKFKNSDKGGQVTITQSVNSTKGVNSNSHVIRDDVLLLDDIED
jgi:hypothetical protein